MRPKVMIVAMSIFCFSNLSVLSFTLEQKTPTKTTDNKLHDLKSVATGKLA